MRKHLHNKLEELMRSLESFLLMDEAYFVQLSKVTSQATEEPRAKRKELAPERVAHRAKSGMKSPERLRSERHL